MFSLCEDLFSLSKLGVVNFYFICRSLDLGLGTPPESHLSVLVWVIIFTTIAVLALAIGLFIFVALWRFCLQRPTFDGYERALLTDSVNVQATA